MIKKPKERFDLWCLNYVATIKWYDRVFTVPVRQRCMGTERLSPTVRSFLPPTRKGINEEGQNVVTLHRLEIFHQLAVK